MASIIDTHGNIAFFGRLSWGNFVDWLVTLCLGAIIALTTVSLGGVRPDTHLLLLPFFAVLLILHGIWLAVNKESPRRISHIPLFFVPAVLWMLCNLLWISPVPWRGWYEMIYTLQVFIFLWVLSNNVRTRAHLWVLIAMSLVPAFAGVFNGFYQFFQDPERMLGAMTSFPLQLSPEYLGRATGNFADPNSFAALLLMLLPFMLIAASVKRLPVVLRLLSFYIALMFIIGIVVTLVFWAWAVLVILMAVLPWFCFSKVKQRLLFSFLGIFTVTSVFVFLAILHPRFEEGLERALSVQDEGVRLVLWQEALAIGAEQAITGVGAGAYGMAFEQSPRVALADAPVTPHNDYLLVFSQLGLLGVFLFGVPSLYVFFKAWLQLRKEPFSVKLRDSRGKIMAPQRFFLSLGLAGALAFALCLSLTFVFYVPALTLYGVLTFTILVKASFTRRIVLPDHAALRVVYLLFAGSAAWSFYTISAPRLEAQALELRAHQQLDHLIQMRVHVAGDVALLDEVIVLYEDALTADPENVDALIGLSESICQLYFRSPLDFEAVAERAVESAQQAVDMNPRYWRCWAQLGVARSFYGEATLAEEAFLHALELAPNNSNAHYYYAAFLSADSQQREQALGMVERALEINPGNTAAQRLQQKLRIL